MFSEIQTIPDAAAEIKGSSEFPEIRGMVYFFGVHNGTIVAADIVAFLICCMIEKIAGGK